jgi:uncharacterized sulfatase
MLIPTLTVGNKPQKRNVIVLLADDQGYCELGSFLKYADKKSLHVKDIPALKEMIKSEGGTEAVQACFDAVKKATPNLDRIAGKGVRFTNFYAAPTCGPSRTALMSSQYPQRMGVYANRELAELGVPVSVNFPVKTFSEAGYKTGLFGKWHLGHKQGQHPNDKGFDTYFGYDLAHTEKYGSKILYRNRENVPAVGWLCDQITDEALEFLDKSAAEKKPFFMYVSYCEPKPPCPKPPREYMDHINSGSFVVDSHFGSLYGMDVGVGKILDKLKQIGADENTMIIYSSDNGLNRGVYSQHPDHRKKEGYPKAMQRVSIPGNGPLRGCKWTSWDGGVKTPMFAYIPGGKPGESTELLSIMDIMPTALDYAGLTTDIQIDGKSFKPLLTGDSTEEEERILYWASMDAITLGDAGLEEFKKTADEFKAIKRKQYDYFCSWYVRSAQWKLVGWNGEKPLLFNIKKDPGEQKNLAIDNHDVVKKLRKKFLDWMEENKEPLVTKKETWLKLFEN